MYKEHISWRCSKLPWRNWLARSAVNRKVGGSSPPGSGSSTLFAMQLDRNLIIKINSLSSKIKQYLVAELLCAQHFAVTFCSISSLYVIILFGIILTII